MPKLEQHDREHCNIKGCGTCDTVVHKIFDQIRENQNSMNNQPIFSPDMPKLPQNIEERFDKFKLKEYGKWKIGRAEAKSFIATILDEERERWIKKIETIKVEEAPPFSANPEFRDKAKLANEILMPSVKEVLINLIKDNE